MHRRTTVLAATLAILVISGARAQSTAPFPGKVVTLVVPFTPNSGSDIIARVIGTKLQARWGQPVIVDNKPGASGNIGTGFVAKAPPDGHTLLMAINTLTMSPWIYKSVPFDVTKDFEPVSKLAEASFALAINPQVPATDMRSLIAYIKKSNGNLNYGTPGNGTPHHLAMELLKANQGLNVTHVPYKGISGALTDLMGGQVQMMFGSMPSLLPQAEAGKLKLVAVTGATRNPLAPQVPTFREQGVAVMDSVDAWYGVLAPAKTPEAIVARLNADFIAVMNLDDVKAELGKQGLTVRTGTPAQLSELIRSDLERWRKVVIDAGIKAE